MRSGNPVLKEDIFKKEVARADGSTMTIGGTVNKTFLLLVGVLLTAAWAWMNPAVSTPMMIPALIVALIAAIVTVFKKAWAPITAPIYALAEGVVLGTISLFFEQRYPGIVGQAVGLTLTILFSLLLLYRSGVIKATENFKLGVMAATGGIFLVYLASFVMRMFFGMSVPFIHEGGLMGIGFSVFVCIIAALNLVLDFDFIESGEAMGAPKYMEWYGAFGLMVTLIWLYLEILRLLAKSRDD